MLPYKIVRSLLPCDCGGKQYGDILRKDGSPMKSIRKLTAILLAVVMVFAMNVGAFATNATATIQVYNGTSTYIPAGNTTFTITSGMTAKDALDLYATALSLTWKEVTNYNTNFAGSGYVVDTIRGVGSEPVGSDSDIDALYWSDDFPGYGIESKETVDGITVYHFIYVGDDWQFTVNGTKPVDSANGYELYMNQYTVQSGDRIAVSYVRQIERWTGTDNWLGGNI